MLTLNTVARTEEGLGPGHKTRTMLVWESGRESVTTTVPDFSKFAMDYTYFSKVIIYVTVIKYG